MDMQREKDWVKAKEAFVQVVVKEIPKLGRQRLVAPTIDKIEGVLGNSLRTLDTLEEQFDGNLYKKTPAIDVEEVADRYENTLKAANTAIGTLVHTLQHAIDQLKGDEEPKNPKMKEALIRGSKVLKTSLDAIAKSGETRLATMKHQLEARHKQISLTEGMHKTFVTVLQSAVARGLAAAQKIKANPTVEVFNGSFPTAARDITQQIANVGKLAKQGLEVPAPSNWQVLAEALKPFGNDFHPAPEGASAEEILQRTSEFNKSVKAVAAGWGLH
jgi:hypothetical protein